MYRKKFCWIFIWAGSWETAGFAIRAAASQYQLSLALYTPQQLLILLAPLWINAGIYMVFGRLVYFFVPERRVVISASRLTLCFILCDVVSFLVQASGGMMLSNTDPSLTNIGLKVYMGGIGLQQAFLFVFLALTCLFYKKIRQHGYTRATDYQWLLYIIWISVALITVRIIFRLREFSAGVNSAVPHTESFQYLFDAVPMFCALFLFNLHHPGRVLVGPESEFEKKSRSQKKEEKRAKKAAKKAGKQEKRELLDKAKMSKKYGRHGAGYMMV